MNSSTSFKALTPTAPAAQKVVHFRLLYVLVQFGLFCNYLSLFQSFDGLDEGIVLLKTQSLKNLSDIGDKSTAEIVAEVAASSSIYSILPQDSFKRFSWSELSQVKYATVSYMSSTKWSTLLDGINGVQSEFVFVDAFCLGGAKKDLDRLAAIKELFARSSEHHIFEPGSIMDGWTWHDLSLLSPMVPRQARLVVLKYRNTCTSI